MESYVRIGGRGLKNITYPYKGVEGGVKNCQNHTYVINEWPLKTANPSAVLRNSFRGKGPHLQESTGRTAFIRRSPS